MIPLQKIKALSNKAEGIYHYIGSDNTLFRLISTGNQLASEVNHAVALFAAFAGDGSLSEYELERVINAISIQMGHLLCEIDIVHAAAGQKMRPDVGGAIQHAYECEYSQLLHEAVINGLPEDYKGPRQNPRMISLVTPSIGFSGEFDPDEFSDGTYPEFSGQEEPRDRCLILRCTGAEFDNIKKYCRALEIKAHEEELKNA